MRKIIRRLGMEISEEWYEQDTRFNTYSKIEKAVYFLANVSLTLPVYACTSDFYHRINSFLGEGGLARAVSCLGTGFAIFSSTVFGMKIGSILSDKLKRRRIQNENLLRKKERLQVPIILNGDPPIRRESYEDLLNPSRPENKN